MAWPPNRRCRCLHQVRWTCTFQRRPRLGHLVILARLSLCRLGAIHRRLFASPAQIHESRQTASEVWVEELWLEFLAGMLHLASASHLSMTARMADKVTSAVVRTTPSGQPCVGITPARTLKRGSEAGWGRAEKNFWIHVRFLPIGRVRPPYLGSGSASGALKSPERDRIRDFPESPGGVRG